jgi:hypothetical protein
MLYFPPNPTQYQRYVATNGVTYTWLGDRWNARQAVEEGVAEYYIDNNDAFFEYNSDLHDELDGGAA